MTTSVENNLVFRSFFEKQKLTGPNFIDWYRQLRLVLLTEDKENFLEHPIPEAPVAPPGQQVPPAAAELKAMFSKQAEQELLQSMREFHTYKQEEVSLILVSLNKDYDSFVQTYNMHGIGKTLNKLHAMLKLHEDTLPKKDATLALHAIRAGRVMLRGVMVKAKGLRESKKLKPGALSQYVGDGHHAAVEVIRTYHLELPSGLVIVLNNFHYAPSITRGVILVSHLFDDGFFNCFDENNVISVSKNNLVYFMAVPQDGIFEIDMSCSNTNNSYMYDISNKRAKIDLDSSLLWHCRLRHISKKRIEKLQHDGLLNSIDIESFGNPSKNKVFVARNAEFFKDDLIDLKASGSVEDLELIQEEDTNPSLDTSLDHEEDDQEINEPQSDINPIRKSSRTRHASNRMCLYINAKEHELGDLNEPANYKAALLDPESKKWLDAMNVEMQSMKDNDVWVLVELPPNARNIGTKWLFKKKTDMDGAVYVFKAHIRAIRILKAIFAHYDYEIWKMDVKFTFLNGHLSEEVYIEQPEGFVNLKYPNHNYNMHGMGKTVNELHAMLNLYEETLPEKDVNHALHAIRAGRVQKKQKNKSHKAGKGSHGKGKGKMGNALNNASIFSKPKTPPPPNKDNPIKDAICHQCGEAGKKLKPGALSLYVADGHRTTVEAIGTYHLELPSGLVIVLNNSQYAPSITRGVISVLRLFNDGFINRFDDNNVISVYKNNLVYFKAVPWDGIYEIDMSCSNTNDSS
nr:hypothetical protein [Tanacetum cinerariifolium]